MGLPLTSGSLYTKSVAQKEVVLDRQIGAIYNLALWKAYAAGVCGQMREK